MNNVSCVKIYFLTSHFPTPIDSSVMNPQKILMVVLAMVSQLNAKK